MNFQSAKPPTIEKDGKGQKRDRKGPDLNQRVWLGAAGKALMAGVGFGFIGLYGGDGRGEGAPFPKRRRGRPRKARGERLSVAGTRSGDRRCAAVRVSCARG